MSATQIVRRTPDVNVCGHCDRACPRGTFLATDGVHYGRACMVKVWKLTGGEIERQARQAETKTRRDAAWAVFATEYPTEAQRLEQLRTIEVERFGVCGVAGEAMWQYTEGHIDAATLISRIALAEDSLAA